MSVFPSISYNRNNVQIFIQSDAITRRIGQEVVWNNSQKVFFASAPFAEDCWDLLERFSKLVSDAVVSWPSFRIVMVLLHFICNLKYWIEAFSRFYFIISIKYKAFLRHKKALHKAYLSIFSKILYFFFLIILSGNRPKLQKLEELAKSYQNKDKKDSKWGFYVAHLSIFNNNFIALLYFFSFFSVLNDCPVTFPPLLRFFPRNASIGCVKVFRFILFSSLFQKVLDSRRKSKSIFRSKICEIRRTLMWALLLGCWQVPVLFVVLLNFPDQWPSQAQSSLAPCSISWISLFDFQCQFWLRANLHTTHTQDVESP